MTKQLPLVVVLGATACGKSKLAIDLAKRFGGEIISADSMQVYHGLDIVTNKVTEEEQSQCKHHMIDFLNPLHRFSVVDFKRKSLDVIGNLMKKDSLPIVVGGTNYYIESLIWKDFLLGNHKESSHGDEEKFNTLIDSEFKLLENTSRNSLHCEEDLENLEKFFQKPIYNDGFKHIASEKLWNLLEQVDTVSAHLYHPNDKRRIIRCLQIIQRKGKNYSDILEEVNKVEKDDVGKSSLGGPLRFNPTCVFWLNCDNRILDEIMDERVDKMLNRGLLAELENFHKDYNRERLEKFEKPDYSKGIFQSIGFKEFHDYLMLSPEVKDTEEGNKILKESIKRMKSSTRRYARSQVKWIKRRFLNLDTRVLPPIFKLETHLDSFDWDVKVKDPAIQIVDSFIKDEPLSGSLVKLKQEPLDQLESLQPGKLYCEPCDRTFIGSHYIKEHLQSKLHRKMTDRLKRKLRQADDKKL